VRLNTEGIFIKVSGVTTEDDALFSIGLGASAVGFDFGPTPRQISVNAAHDIVRRLPVGAISVGVFRNEMPQRIVEIANTLGLSRCKSTAPWRVRRSPTCPSASTPCCEACRAPPTTIW